MHTLVVWIHCTLVCTYSRVGGGGDSTPTVLASTRLPPSMRTSYIARIHTMHRVVRLVVEYELVKQR